MKMVLNGSPMAPHGLILSQDGAMASRMVFKSLLRPGNLKKQLKRVFFI